MSGLNDLDTPFESPRESGELRGSKEGYSRVVSLAEKNRKDESELETPTSYEESSVRSQDSNKPDDPCILALSAQNKPNKNSTTTPGSGSTDAIVGLSMARDEVSVTSAFESSPSAQDASPRHP